MIKVQENSYLFKGDDEQELKLCLEIIRNCAAILGDRVTTSGVYFEFGPPYWALVEEKSKNTYSYNNLHKFVDIHFHQFFCGGPQCPCRNK